ncbi:ribosome small subunit-dependent GTPase A [Pirellula staleyi DSM 6068]|uniref:Small ribosomal subunit biogenesis GTPase RsgA n=1 Tax=Pirellula staleyi (strain ATCC 27377 / DSM 6068 / ICPB 4128) TaxID=530564 RepID=D2R982_PIRSD|nr:ribosome small subunit-dependent GTPase A [Pirellula staleyi]ADB17632.1 ribosome small subunit-dependent GTPase A [Pirellula staleyi DSM 6068]
MAKKEKIRTDFRKGHQSRTRNADLTRDYNRDELVEDDVLKNERVSGKGDLTRKRTVVGDHAGRESAGFDVTPDVSSEMIAGRVLSVHGLLSHVQIPSGEIIRCATRRVLKNLSTDQRHVVAAGDIVYYRPNGTSEGLIERIEPRANTLSRTSKGRQHVIVANVDQVLIVASAAEPSLKPNLIDRMIVEAERTGIRPVVCINKVDLVEPSDLQPIAGVYGQLGYDVLLLSAKENWGISRLRKLVAGKQTVVAGQSGVGKSSILNAIENGLALRVGRVSEENQKGRHTTTTAKLIPLAAGGYVVDTPGIRSFELWDIIPAEVIGYYRDLRPYVCLCRYPDCTHLHETDCAVKDAVADGRLDVRRYESYCYLFEGDAV